MLFKIHSLLLSANSWLSVGIPHSSPVAAAAAEVVTLTGDPSTVLSKSVEDDRGGTPKSSLGTMLGVFVASTGETSAVTRSADTGEPDDIPGGEYPSSGGGGGGKAESSLVETLANEYG